MIHAAHAIHAGVIPPDEKSLEDCRSEGEMTRGGDSAKEACLVLPLEFALLTGGASPATLSQRETSTRHAGEFSIRGEAGRRRTIM